MSILQQLQYSILQIRRVIEHERLDLERFMKKFDDIFTNTIYTDAREFYWDGYYNIIRRKVDIYYSPSSGTININTSYYVDGFIGWRADKEPDMQLVEYAMRLKLQDIRNLEKKRLESMNQGKKLLSNIDL